MSEKNSNWSAIMQSRECQEVWFCVIGCLSSRFFGTCPKGITFVKRTILFSLKSKSACCKSCVCSKSSSHPRNQGNAQCLKSTLIKMKTMICTYEKLFGRNAKFCFVILPILQGLGLLGCVFLCSVNCNGDKKGNARSLPTVENV